MPSYRSAQPHCDSQWNSGDDRNSVSKNDALQAIDDVREQIGVGIPDPNNCTNAW